MEIGLEFFQMFDRIARDRRESPRDDLATMLATATMADGQPMGPVETFGYYLIVFTAGHDTTRNALFYASANRDEDVFEDPFRFDLTRHPNRHLGFGTGEHFCLGAHLARASIRAVLEEVAARVERLEPAGDPSQIHASFVVGRKTLPVRYKIKRRS